MQPGQIAVATFSAADGDLPTVTTQAEQKANLFLSRVLTTISVVSVTAQTTAYCLNDRNYFAHVITITYQYS